MKKLLLFITSLLTINSLGQTLDSLSLTFNSGNYWFGTQSLGQGGSTYIGSPDAFNVSTTTSFTLSFQSIFTVGTSMNLICGSTSQSYTVGSPNNKVIVNNLTLNQSQTSFTIHVSNGTWGGDYGAIQNVKLYYTKNATNLPCLPDISTSLVAKYDFTGNANDGVGSFNGTVTTATLSTDRFSNANSCYYFNGSDSKITFGANTPMSQLYNDFTINFWIKPLSNGMIMGSYDWGYNVGINSNKVTYGFVNSSNWNYSTTNSNVNNNTWSMVSFTRESNQIKVYVNSVLDQTYNGVPMYSIPSSNNSYFIGGNSIDNNGFFNGSLDDIKYYNRCLRQCDIDSLYNTPNPIISGLNELTNSTINFYSHSNSIYIDNIENVKIDVYNLSGELIYSNNVNSHKIDLNVSNGIYLVKLSNGNKYSIKKVFINN